MGAGAATVLMSTLALQYATASTSSQSERLPVGIGLKNGDFEDPKLEGVDYLSDADLPGWEVKSELGAILATNLGQAKAPEGVQFASVQGAVSQTVKTTPGTKMRWRLSHSIKSDTEGTEEKFRVRMSSADGSSGVKDFFPTTGEGWRVASGEYEVPKGQDSTLFQIYSPDGFDSSLHIDDIKLEYATSLRTEVSGGDAPLQPGDDMELTSTVFHDGGSPADGTVLSVPLPDGIGYVDKSARVSRVFDGKETDADVENGQVSVSNGKLFIRIGEGADSSGGGRVVSGDQYIVTYKVKITDKDRVPSDLQFSHQPVLDYQWKTGKSSHVTRMPEKMISIASADIGFMEGGGFTAKTYAKGDPAELAMKVKNVGPNDARGVTLKIGIPKGVTNASVEGLDCAEEDGKLHCRLDTIAKGEERTVTLKGVVNSDSPSLWTQADLSTDTIDETASNDTQVFESKVTKDVDVEVATAVLDPSDGKPASSLEPKGEAVLKVAVRNTGPADAEDVKVKVPLPQGAKLAAEADERYDPATQVWKAGKVVRGADWGATLELPVTVPAEFPSLQHYAEALSLDVHDTNLDNNRSASHVTVAQKAAVNVKMSADRDVAVPGDPMTYTIEVTNEGPSPTTDVRVSHALQGIGVEHANAPIGTSYNFDSGEWSIHKTIDVGETVKLKLTGTVPADQESLEHTACITGAAIPDPDGFGKCGENARHHVSHQLAVTQQADVGLKVEADKKQARPGQQVTWTVRALNSGPSTAKGLLVQAPVPEGLTDVAVDTTGGSFDKDTGVWKPADIGRHGEAVMKVTGTIPADRPMAYTAQVTQTATPLKDQDKIVGVPVKHTLDVVQQADLEVSVTSQAESVKAGEQGSVTVAVSNAGPSTARETAVELALPSGLKGLAHDGGAGFDPVTGTWEAGEIKAGEERSLTLTFTADKAKEYRFDVLAVSSRAEDPNECADICGSTSVMATASGGGQESGDGPDPDESAGEGGSQPGAGGDGGGGEEQSVLDQALAATGSNARWWGLGALGAVGVGGALLLVARRRTSG